MNLVELVTLIERNPFTIGLRDDVISRKYITLIVGVDNKLIPHLDLGINGQIHPLGSLTIDEFTETFAYTPATEFITDTTTFNIAWSSEVITVDKPEILHFKAPLVARVNWVKETSAEYVAIRNAYGAALTPLTIVD